ncbi:hypothetical protein [Hymenobacter segetis]
MKNLLTAFLFSPLLLSVRAAVAQAPAARGGSARLTISNPVSIPLFASINKVPQLVSAEDSLDRRIFARNRVRTVTVVRQIDGFGPDTSEHFELDRRGNKIRIDQAHGGQSRLQRFDKHSRQVELVLTAVPSFPVSTRIVYDAQTKVNTSYLTVQNSAPVLWQQAQEYRRGDTTVTEAIFNPIPGLKANETHRLLSLMYPTGGDTLRLESIGYNQSDEPVDFSAIYIISRHGKTIENGHINYSQPQAGALAKPVVPAAVLRLSRQQRGRCIPDTRNEYDQRGQLIQSISLFEPRRAERQAQPGAGSLMTVSDSPFSSFTTRYTRLPDGRVKRQEQLLQVQPGKTVDERLLRPIYTEYEYGANGLLLRKTDNRSYNQLNVYEVKYTYY